MFLHNNANTMAFPFGEHFTLFETRAFVTMLLMAPGPSIVILAQFNSPQSRVGQPLDFFPQLSFLESFVMTLELHHDGRVRGKSNPLCCQFLAAFSVTLS